MNMQTGEIKDLSNLTPEEVNNFVPLTEKQHEELEKLPQEERVDALKMALDAAKGFPEQNVPPSMATQVEQYAEQPEDTAARMYGYLMPKFEDELPKLGKKGLVRVLTALVKVPLMDIHFKMDATENNVCSLASKLLQCKNVMETSVLMNYMKEEEEKEKNKVVGEKMLQKVVDKEVNELYNAEAKFTEQDLDQAIKMAEENLKERY